MHQLWLPIHGYCFILCCGKFFRYWSKSFIGTSFWSRHRHVAAAATIAEKRQRIATLAAFLATSTAAVTTDPTTNAAVGGAIA